MLSFHGDQKVKDLYLDRCRVHRIMDSYVQQYIHYYNADSHKGCAIGCTLETGLNYKAGDRRCALYALYESKLGLPMWLAQLEEIIFESLPLEEAKGWPEEFISAIPVGVDYSNGNKSWLAVNAKNLAYYGDTRVYAALVRATLIEFLKSYEPQPTKLLNVKAEKYVNF